MEATDLSASRSPTDKPSEGACFDPDHNNIDAATEDEESARSTAGDGDSDSRCKSKTDQKMEEAEGDVGDSESVITSVSPSFDDMSSKSKVTDENTAKLAHFSNDGPVFPIRHTREVQQLSSYDANLPVNSDTKELVDFDTATRNVLLSYIDRSKPTREDNSSQETKNDDHLTKSEQSRNNSAKQDEIIASGSSGSLDNSSREDTRQKGGPSSSADTESESLPPLSASFFNCQYQTPSWIDDPLIGVPPCAMENKNTHRKTGADMRILTAYMRSLNEMRLPEAIPPTELDKYLSSFFLVVRKADGSEYEPCSLRAMLASIERYLRFKNYPLSLTRDSAFSNMRNVLKLKQQTLRSIGKGQKNPSEISPSSLAREGKIAHLFKSQEMGPYTPSSVVFTLCFYFCMYLRIRKSTENKKLLWGDIVLCKDESGREFLTFSSQMLRRSQSSSKGTSRQRNYRVWADPSCPEKDPVTIYKFYAQKRPSSMNTNFAPFYLGINVLYPTQGQLWYRPAAMGINKLNEMVRQIRDITGIRNATDFHSEIKMVEKQRMETDVNNREDNSPSIESGDRQDSEGDMKNESLEEMEEDDGRSSVALDFSQDQQELNHQPMDVALMTQMRQPSSVVYSDGDSNDSISQQSALLKQNGEVLDARRNGDLDQELDLTRRSNSPLNCSTKDRVNFLNVEEVKKKEESGSIGLDEAKQCLLSVMRRLEPSEVSSFNCWLKGVKVTTDPLTGELIWQEEPPPMTVEAVSSTPGKLGTNITLNISLSPQALHGDGPITVTAQTNIPSQQQQSSSNLASSGPFGSSTLSQLGRAASQLYMNSSPDTPLDLATSPLSRSGATKPAASSTSVNSASGSASQHQRLLGGLGTNGVQGFPASLGKHVHISAEQAEAYASASIMASLSSASLFNERLRLMQAGLGDYGLDLHAGSLVTGTDALRSQLLQHYGIKAEPK